MLTQGINPGLEFANAFGVLSFCAKPIKSTSNCSVGLRVKIRAMSAEQSSRIQNQQIPIAEPLVEVTRGGLTESRHRGHIVAVEPDGTTVAYLGVPGTVTFLRSSAKPLQALPLLVSGAAD